MKIKKNSYSIFNELLSFANLDISKTITARSFKLVQLIEDNLVKIKRKYFLVIALYIFRVIALCKFGH